MKQEDVPQFLGGTYGGHRKLLYAVGSDGRYRGVESVGCETEALATRDAIDELDRAARDAWDRARQGEATPLEFHMYRCRMDVTLLAQAAGLRRWRVRRHLRPARFGRLSERILRRYATALGIDVKALLRLPDAP